MPDDELTLQRLAQLAREEVQVWHDQYTVLRVAMDLSPLPMWVKALEHDDEGKPAFKMLRINRAYELRWGINRVDYEGKFDAQVWGEEIAAGFFRNDMEAVTRAPHAVYCEERVPSHPGEIPDATTPVWRIGKVSADDSGARFVVGVAWRTDAMDALAQHLEADSKLP